MFPTIRYSLAVNGALWALAKRGRLSEEKRKLMDKVAGSGTNRVYGVALIRTGASRSKEAAAASVFTRLAGAAARSPGGDVSADDWTAAARQALLNAGAEEIESYLTVAALIDDIAEAEGFEPPSAALAVGVG